MLPDWVTTYLGGGLLIVICYVLVSNTFWLLFGSSVVQRFPGVHIKGAKGTLKIAILILLCIIGLTHWLIMLPFNTLKNEPSKKSLRDYLSSSIQTAGSLFQKIIKNRSHE